MKKRVVLIMGLLLTACGNVENVEKEEEHHDIPLEEGELTQEVQPDFKALEASIDHFLTEQAFNGVALVASGDQLLLNKGYGLADLETKTQNETTTKFHVASVSKSFVAVSVLQLVEAGKLALEDKVSDYFPDIPNGDLMTIHDLLTHASGLYDANTYGGYDEKTTVEDLIAAAFEEDNLYFEEDTEDNENSDQKDEEKEEDSVQTIYSNLGYDVLGAIIAKVSEMPYEAYIQKHIFEPTNMSDSMLNVEGVTIDKMATAYSGDINEGYVARKLHPSFGYSSGGIHSTVEDLYRYDRALASHTLITEESYELMVTPYTQVNGNPYSYGWFIGEELEGVVSHPGNLIGWHSMFLRHNEGEVTVILLTNHDNSDMNMAYDIARLVLSNVKEGQLLISE